MIVTIKFLGRFIGTLFLTLLFGTLVEFIHYIEFNGVVHYFSDFSWRTWFGYDMLRTWVLLPGWAILWLIGYGMVMLVKGNKIMAIVSSLYLAHCAVHDFSFLFIDHSEVIIDEIGLGFWYYVGSIITYVLMLLCYILVGGMLFLKHD